MAKTLYSYKDQRDVQYGTISHTTSTDDELETLAGSGGNTSKSNYSVQLLIYIRNYNQNDELVENPKDAVKILIDTFERKITTLKSLGNVPYYDEETGEEKTKEEYVTNTIVLEDPVEYIDDEIKVVEPHIIPDTRFLKEFLEDYFENYGFKGDDTERTISITVNNSYSYEYYDNFDSKFLNTMSGTYKFSSIYLSLDNHTFTIDDKLILVLDTLNLENCNIVIKDKTGFSVKGQNCTFNNCKFETDLSGSDTPTISLQIAGVVYMRNIEITKNIVYFNIVGDEEAPTKWVKSTCYISNVFYTNKGEHNDKLKNLISVKSIYKVDISFLNISAKSFNVGVLKLNNSYKATLSNVNINISDVIERNLFDISKVSDFSACTVLGFQTKKDIGKKSYLFHISGGDINSTYKFTSIVSRNFGLFNIVGDESRKMSLSNCQCIDYSVPINYANSSVMEFIANKCSFINPEEFELSVVKLTLFDTTIRNVNKLTLVSVNKGFINNCTFVGSEGNFIVDKSGDAIYDHNYFKFDTITVSGQDSGGRFSLKECNIISKEFEFMGLDRLSSEQSEYAVNTMKITAGDMYSFNPIFKNSILDTLDISGKINYSTIAIMNTHAKKIKYNFKNVIGSVNIYYLKEIASYDLSLENAKIDITLDAREIEKEISANITCVKECGQSVIRSSNSLIKLAPVAEGDFNKMKMYYAGDNLNTSDWLDKIAYGYE